VDRGERDARWGSTGSVRFSTDVKNVLLVAIVGLIGLLLGALVAGRPRSVSNDLVLSPSVITARATTTITVDRATTTSAASATSTSAAVTTSAPRSTISAATSPTTPPTEPTTTTTTRPAPPSANPLPESVVRLIVANATNVDGVANQTRDDVLRLGYASAIIDDALIDRADTVVYYAAGRRPEADHLAGQLGLGPDRVQPRQPGAITVGNQDAELWLVIGADRL
jgi:hypothetical protein